MLALLLCQTASNHAFGQAPPQDFPLQSAGQLKLVGVVAEAAEFAGAKAIRIRVAPDVKPGSQAVDTPTFALVQGTEEFRDGTIEVTLESELLPNAPPAARGFVGLAFRIAPDFNRFEAVYLRPLNSRVDDQVRRNHSTQYMSFPKYDFAELRAEDPARYESYVDIGPREWIRMRIEVQGERARLFVNNAAEPTLIVNGLKLGADAKGPIGLWVYNGTNAHFRDLRVTRR